MRITTITLAKQFKCGLPNYSNLTTSMSMTWELAEGEAFDFSAGWDTINQQLQLEGDGMEQSWIKTKDYKEKTKVIIDIPKKGGEHGRLGEMGE